MKPKVSTYFWGENFPRAVNIMQTTKQANKANKLANSTVIYFFSRSGIFLFFLYQLRKMFLQVTYQLTHRLQHENISHPPRRV